MRKQNAPAGASPDIQTEAREKHSELQSAAQQIVEDLAAGRMEAVETDYEAVAEMQEVGLRASELAVQLAKQKARETEERRKAFMRARAQGRTLPPVRAVPEVLLDDATLPLDRDGKLAGTPGTKKRWVRMIDAAGNPSHNRVNMFAKQGYTPVVSRKDNQPITQMAHMLMEATPEADAQRVAIAMEGRVSAGKQAAQEYHDAIEQGNRAAGQTVLRPFAAEGHGEKRRFGSVITPE